MVIQVDSLERFYRTIAREPVDRPACWLGMPDTAAQPGLMAHYGVKNMHDLRLAIGDDVYTVEMPYQNGNAHAIYAAFDWYQDGDVSVQDRTLTVPGFFEEYEDPDRVDEFPWPDPDKGFRREECAALLGDVPKGKAVLGILWSAHFQDACAAFGMETALMNMLTNPEIYAAVNERILRFYLRANEMFYEATKGKVHAVLIGNDMGSQQALMLSPALIREFVIPGAKRLIEQAHSYGLKVIYHSCGAISDIIPALYEEAGADVVHPIQALAAGMEPRSLKERFGDKVAFCGGVDQQYLLVNGPEKAIRDKVGELREIFPTGLIISPSHEAILPDVPPSHIAALFEEATKL